MKTAKSLTAQSLMEYDLVLQIENLDSEPLNPLT